jgi:hypothetical protein
MASRTTSTIEIRPTTPPACAGATLVEYLFAISVSTLVGLVIVGLSLNTGRNFAAMANYSDLNASNVNALDQMTRDIRQAVNLTAYSSTQLTFSNGTNGLPVVFTYSPFKRTLSRQQGTSTKVLLTECDTLNFAIYQRTTIAGSYDQYPVGSVGKCKVVAVNWSCSRKILGAKVNSEAGQSTKIVIRQH